MIIPVVIVESHQHVLEHIHEVLRKKKIFDETWSMVHIDAHPDLACSRNAPAASFFNPRHWCSQNERKVDGDDTYDTREENDGMDLYELLDLSQSGIAEWILPLVLAAKLNKIEWVKPNFSKQISQGKYKYAVGVECCNRCGRKNECSKDVITSYLDLPNNSKVKVDFNHPYYLDDLSVVSSNELVLKQNLELSVSELRPLPVGRQEEKAVPRGARNRNLWILDICLDYFTCQNPFISDLENANPVVARAFLNVMKASKFNAYDAKIDTNQPITSLEYQTEVIHFYDQLKKLLFENLRVSSKERQTIIEENFCTNNTTMSFDEISEYFQTADQAESLIRQLINEINNDDNDRTRLSSMVAEAIPNWSMPHDRSSTASEKIDESLFLVETYIERHVRDFDQPFLITIARSTLDGFCPSEVVETLQNRVMDMLHRQIRRKLLVVRDYGEWEGSIIPQDAELETL